MADDPGKMLFWKPATGSGKLVFGDAPSTGPVIPGASISIDADFADAAPSLHLAHGPACSIDAGFGDDAAVVADLQLAWDANASRTLLARGQPHWQNAAPTAAAARSHWQRSVPVRPTRRPAWQQARPAGAATRARWQRSRSLQPASRPAWQQAQPLQIATRGAWQQAITLRAGASVRWQDAAPLPASAVRARYQQCIALHRDVRALWQPARGPILHLARPPLRNALALPIAHVLRWQLAQYPLPGITPAAPPPSPHPPCYDPARLGLLVFQRPFTGDGKLVFVCARGGGVGPEQPPATVILARRRTYIVINSIEVRRVDTDQVLPALDSGFAMQLERGSWSWGFTVNFHASALPLLQPGGDGLPVELEVKVNGQPFRMLAEQLSRSVQHPRAVVQVRGASPSALLDAPYAPQQSFTQPAMRTAQQLMLDVLTVGGVSMGWTLDWQITDWTLPAGTWAHQGSWISAINDIAGSVGAYVQPHDTAHTLRILPAWPVRGWLMAGATPDIDLPPGIAAVEEVEWLTKPAYDGLYLRGEPGTYNYFRKRAGTPGTTLAPQAVHPLLVDAAAAAQRAIAELSDTGRQVEQQLQLMVHPETGIIKPGTLLRYTDDAAVQRSGITRAVSVQMAGPKLTQTIRVQAPEAA